MRTPAALAIASAVALLGSGCGGGDTRADETERGPEIRAERAQPLPFAHLGAMIQRRTPLRAEPDGSAELLGMAARRTEFGNRTVLHVTERRDGWLRVLHQSLGNEERAWIAEDDATLVREPWAIDVDLSDREGVVRLHGKVLSRFGVGVGRTGTDTPTGTFAVTDLIRTRSRSTYGCCILALTGHQPNLPPGWIGGDRIALHGTADEGSVGAARSAGCLRVRERDLRMLMRRIRLGSRVTIRA